MKHPTPGRWHAQRSSDKRQHGWIRCERKASESAERGIAVARICTSGLPYDETEANLDMLAASPRLLEVLERIINAATAPMSDGDISLEDVEAARRVIADAKGRVAS